MIGEKMKSTSNKKVISCTLAIIVLITSTFSLRTTIKVNAIDSFEVHSVKQEKVNNKKKSKQVKADFKLSDIPDDLKENTQIDTRS